MNTRVPTAESPRDRFGLLALVAVMLFSGWLLAALGGLPRPPSNFPTL